MRPEDEALKNALLSLAPEVLAESLIHLSSESESAAALVRRLTSTKDENIKRFKSRLRVLMKDSAFYDWKTVRKYAAGLESMLQDLEAGVEDPKSGLICITEFFRADEEIFTRCDDSNGYVGDIFRYDAKNLFVEYASQIEDKGMLAQLVLDLCSDDPYGIRHVVVESVEAFLPKERIVQMVRDIEASTDPGLSSYDNLSRKVLMKTLARQSSDPDLLHEVILSWEGEVRDHHRIELASMYVEIEDYENALQQLRMVPDDSRLVDYERTKLLQAIYEGKGDRERLGQLLTERLRTHPSLSDLNALLDVVGSTRRTEIIEEVTKFILARRCWSSADASFLVEVGDSKSAAEYVLACRLQIDGQSYSSLLPLTDVFVDCDHLLAASILLRKLATSILYRGVSKIYHHAVDYVRKLDRMAVRVEDWQDIGDHQEFMTQLQQDHGLKRKFWSLYRDALSESQEP